MITLAVISGLGIVCLLLEILNLRKVLVPVTLLGLLAALVISVVQLTSTTFTDWNSFGMIQATNYSIAFSILFIILAFFIILMSPTFYVDKIEKIADYVSIKVFLLAGAVAMVSFQNFAMFFIGLEVLSIAAYVLASSKTSDLKSNEAGMKYFIMGAFASSFILLGIAFIYGATGSFNISEIELSSLIQLLALPIWFKIGFLLIFVGLLFKASVVPFHFWAPDVYQGSPTIVTALMSTLVKVAAVAALFKVVGVLVAMLMQPYIITTIIILSILSLVVGNVTALRQTNLKRMMAYSGISHAGFMLMALLATQNSMNTVLYYASAYSLAAIAAFAVILAVTQNKDNEEISNFNGLAKRNPLLAGAMTCAMLSLGGIPVFAGFFGKMFLFNQMFISNHIVLVIFGVICSIIGVFYYFGVVNTMFFKKSEDTTSLKVSVNYSIVAVVAIVLNLLIAIFPSIIMDLKI